MPALGALHDSRTPAPVLTLVFRSSAGELRFFETITTFSMPRAVALEELRIECAFPADDHTDTRVWEIDGEELRAQQ